MTPAEPDHRSTAQGRTQMNVLAIYAVNQHLADLHEEARQARLVESVQRPSLVRRILAAIRNALGAASATSPTAASAA
jgi:hypothetical protein